MPSETIRRRIISLLADREMDARELGVELGLTEKEIYAHLSHVRRSIAASGGGVCVRPPPAPDPPGPLSAMPPLQAGAPLFPRRAGRIGIDTLF
ncbi:MAG: transcriptional regulator [Desulfobacterales bacterium]|nr:transcriptional regulator [Desulfobacterales bacterium]